MHIYVSSFNYSTNRNGFFPLKKYTSTNVDQEDVRCAEISPQSIYIEFLNHSSMWILVLEKGEGNWETSKLDHFLE